MIALDTLNVAAAVDFVDALAGIFEHSPWVAERTAPGRPFASRLHLLDAMRDTVARATREQCLMLIRAHPQLGVRGAPRLDLTAASAQEQRRAGLDACTAQDFARLDELNSTYTARFGMPFIVAVRGHDPASIIATFEQRLTNDQLFEEGAALRQIGLIAGFRLADRVATPAAVEMAAMCARLAQASADAARALLREWMHAAELEVSTDGCGDVVGRRSGAHSARCVSLGAGRDADEGACGGPRGFLAGIAVLQDFRQRGVRLPFDVAVVARVDESTGMGTGGVAGVAEFERATRAVEQLLESIIHG